MDRPRNLFCLIMVFVLFQGCASVQTTLPVLPRADFISAASIDERGLTITPAILLAAARAMKGIQAGQVLEIVTDDFAPISPDLLAWARLRGYPVVHSEKGQGFARYYIEKPATEKTQRKRMVMVISDAGLEKLLAPLGFALSAAVSGDEVNIFFQGEATQVLKKGFKEKLSGIRFPFSDLARDALAKVGHAGPQDKLRAIQELGGHLYICGGSMDYFSVKKEDIDFEDVRIVEYFSIYELMRNADAQVFLQ